MGRTLGLTCYRRVGHCVEPSPPAGQAEDPGVPGPVAGVVALHPPVLPVRYAHLVLVSRQGHAVGDVERTHLRGPRCNHRIFFLLNFFFNFFF